MVRRGVLGFVRVAAINRVWECHAQHLLRRPADEHARNGEDHQDVGIELHPRLVEIPGRVQARPDQPDLQVACILEGPGVSFLPDEAEHGNKVGLRSSPHSLQCAPRIDAKRDGGEYCRKKIVRKVENG